MKTVAAVIVALAALSSPAWAVELERDEELAVSCEVQDENIHSCQYPTADTPEAICINAASVDHDWSKLAAYLNGQIVRQVAPTAFLIALDQTYQQGWVYIPLLDKVCLVVTFRKLGPVS